MKNIIAELLLTQPKYIEEDVASAFHIDRRLMTKYKNGEQPIPISLLEQLGDLYYCDLIHTSLGNNPTIQINFHVDKIDATSIKAIQVVNRIFLNSVSMANLLKN